MRHALTDIHGVHLLYIAEIVPPAETAVEAFESTFIPESQSQTEKSANGIDIEMDMLKGHIQLATFTGLKKDVNYTIKVRTVVNGKTICHVREQIKTDAENLPTETQEAPV